MFSRLLSRFTARRLLGRFGRTGYAALRLWGLLKESAVGWQDHKTPRMGAALSYYAAFSLAPLITLVLSLASLAVRRDEVARGLVEQFSALVGVQGGRVVGEIVAHTGTMKALSWSTGLSFALLMISASGAFGELQDSLNEIWEVPTKKSPWRQMIRERLLSFSMVFILGFFMLTSLVISTVVVALSRYLIGGLPVWTIEGINTAVSLVAITVLFATLFRMLPAVTLRWRDVFPGALFSSVLFLVGKLVIGIYIAHSAFASSYGVAGSFIVLLVWIFYSAQILYFGAEFTRAYTKGTAKPAD
ncbi:MAG TPA: YihY/virulence factor BrkB family protein [Candidatus Methylacidiphilales bacterium]